jgi:hypothetical protein
LKAKIGDKETGVEIEDLLDSHEFMSRHRGVSDPSRRPRALRRLNECLRRNPSTILHELMEIAVEFCHADSAGISLEEQNDDGRLQFRWVAVAGSFGRYLNGTTPRNYSPCGTCIDRGMPQHYKVMLPYYNFLGVDAEPILDGLLIPWRTQKSQGTIWVVSHRTEQAFDRDDFQFMRTMAEHVSSKLQTLGN